MLHAVNRLFKECSVIGKIQISQFCFITQLIPASLRPITLRITQSMAIANNNGNRMQPWRTPVVTSNHPLISLFILIALQQSIYRLCIMSTSRIGSPYHSRIFHNAGLLMLSNTLRKSTKFTITGYWPPDTFSVIFRREKIWSIQIVLAWNPLVAGIIAGQLYLYMVQLQTVGSKV